MFHIGTNPFFYGTERTKIWNICVYIGTFALYSGKSDVQQRNKMNISWNKANKFCNKNIFFGNRLIYLIFQQSKFRNVKGRYVVALPFDPSKSTEVLGESRSVALQCLYRLEKRFEKNSVIKERYTKYIQNLIESNHIELVPQNRLNITDHKKFYLPHPPVLKEASLTTKLRVVFNASQKTKTGVS